MTTSPSDHVRRLVAGLLETEPVELAAVLELLGPQAKARLAQIARPLTAPPPCFRRVGPASGETYADCLQAAATAVKRRGETLVRLHVDDALEIAGKLREPI